MLARTADQLPLPALPEALAAAEAKVSELCAESAATEERLYILTDAAHAMELGADLAELDGRIENAKAEREQLRDKFGEEARKALAPAVSRYETELHRKIDGLEDLLRCGLRLHTDAVWAGIDLQPVISGCREAVAAIRVCRASLNRKRKYGSPRDVLNTENTALEQL
jgi:hypothetical protein